MVNETAAPDARVHMVPLVALCVAVGLEIVYILLFSPFFTVDTGNHLATAAALVDSLGEFELGKRFLEWNLTPEPNLLSFVLLALLIPLVGIATAETLVLIGYVVALAAAAWYAVRSAPGGEWLVLFVLPLTFSLSFLWGFLSFSYSVAVFLVVAGYILRTDVGMPGRRTVGLAALLTFAFFTHLVGYLASGLFVVAVLVARAALSPSLRRAVVIRGTSALLPSALLALVFVLSSGSESPTAWGNPVRRLAGIVTLKSAIVAYERLEIVFCLLAAGALWVLIVVALVRSLPWLERDPDTIGVGSFTLAITVVAMFAPHSVASGGSELHPRLALFSALGAVLWLSRQQFRRALLIGAAVVAIVAAAGLAFVRYDELRYLERVANDLSAVTPCVERGSTIVQGNLAYVPFNSSKFDPDSAQAGRVAAARDGLDLGNGDFGVPFWVQQYRSETNPYIHLALPGTVPGDVPPPLDFDAFERATGRYVDYVLLWGRPEMTDETRISPSWRRFDRELRGEYSLARRSPLGWWEIWSREGRGCAEASS